MRRSERVLVGFFVLGCPKYMNTITNTTHASLTHPLGRLSWVGGWMAQHASRLTLLSFCDRASLKCLRVLLSRALKFGAG